MSHLHHASLKKILSDKRTIRLASQGDISGAIKAAQRCIVKNLPPDYSLIESLISDRKRAGGVMLPTLVQDGSTLQASLVSYVNTLEATYESMCAASPDGQFPLSKEIVYTYAISQGAKVIGRGNRWSITNLSSSNTWEMVNVSLSEMMVATLDPNPALTTHLISLIRRFLQYREDIRADYSKMARLVRFIDRLAEAFSLPAKDTEEMRNLLRLSCLVAKASFVSVKGEFTPENEFLRLGFLCGTDFESSNTAVDRIKQAIFEHKNRTKSDISRKNNRTVSSDDLDL